MRNPQRLPYPDLWQVSRLLAGDGSASLPSITFANDKNTGFYWYSADKIGVTVGGTFLLGFTTNLIDSQQDIQLNTEGTATASVTTYNSRDFILQSSAWNTAGAGSEEKQTWKIRSTPTSGNPSSSVLYFLSQRGAAAEVTQFTVSSSGNFQSTSAVASYTGYFYAGNSVAMSTYGRIADGGTAIGNKVGNATALTTAGAKIIAWYSDALSTEKAYLSCEGNFYSAGRKLGFQGADVTAANDITLGLGNYFDITGATEIQRILGTSWTAGSIVTLQFDSTPQVTNGTAAGGGYFGFQLSGAGNFAAGANDTLTLVFDGAWWREVARTVI